MWEPVVLNNVNYLIKWKSGSPINIYFTDFKKIWIEELSEQDIASRFEELNPLFDSSQMNEEEVVNYVISVIKNIGSDTSMDLSGNDQITIELRWKLLDSSVKFKFNMDKGDDTMYFNEFTLPLMQSVQYLEMRQRRLFDLLEKKDKEIQEHVMENGEITRKVLVTKKFDRNDIMEAVPEELLVSIFGKSKNFFQTFSQNFSVVKFNNNVKQDGEPSRKKFKNSVT